MKRSILILFILNHLLSFGQVSIIDLSIYPAFPSDQDTIYLISLTGMSNSPINVVYEQVTDNGNHFIVEVCQGAGPGDAYMELPDTFLLGVKPAGTYQVYFKANGTFCNNSSDIYVDSISFQIGYSNMIENVKEDSLMIYPNPVTEGILFFNHPGSAEIYYIYDSTGKKIIEWKSNQQTAIDVSSLQAGIYLIHAYDSGILFTEKFIVK